MSKRGRLVYLTSHDRDRAQGWIAAGFTEALRTPDSTLIFVTPENALEIRADQINCMGCRSGGVPTDVRGPHRLPLHQTGD